MLVTYPRAASDPSSGAAADLTAARWIDLLDPTPQEVARVEQALSLKLPTRETLSEIEVTSRLQQQGEVLIMSAPLLTGAHGETAHPAPVGFVLARTVCVTIRFDPIAAFDEVAKACSERAPERSDLAFLALVEEVVDRVADHLELTANALNEASMAIFRADGPRRARLSKDTNQLRQAMTRIGRASERMSHARYTLVCLARMAQFVLDRARDWICPTSQDRLGGAKADISSLEQFEEHLLSRVQLLQDAATAFISIEQNDVVKVLTIASVAGIPPVLVVGVYGMNFKNMPELGWTYGYPYALALIVITTVIPLLWFKIKDWM